MEGELDTAIIEHHDAANEARDAAREAEIAAAVAMGASSAQSALVGAAMEAGREDSQNAAMEAEAAAVVAEEAASDAITINAALLGQFERFNSAIMERLDQICVRLDEMESSSAPPPVAVVNQPEVQTISPDETPSEEVDTGGEEEAPTKSRSKRKFGR